MLDQRLEEQGKLSLPVLSSFNPQYFSTAKMNLKNWFSNF